MVVAQFQTICGAGRKSPEVLQDSLADRFEGFEAGRLLHGVDAHTFGRAVIDCRENGYATLCFCEGGRSIGAPHLVGRGGHDRALMRVAGSWLGMPRRGE